jgi:hypothetical protein
VEFTRTRGGPWIVRRWAIRMPLAELRNTPRLPGVGQGAGPSVQLQLVGVHEAGGEVGAVRIDGGREETTAGPPPAPHPVVRGVAWDSSVARPLAGARVFLSGTGAEAITDAAGHFQLEAPAPGSYTLALSAPALAGAARVLQPLAVTLGAGDTLHAVLAVPAAERLRTLLCPAAQRSGLRGAVTGRVLGVDPATVEVHAFWLQVGLGTKVTVMRGGTASLPDPEGVFVLCGVSEGIPVRFTLHARATARAPASPALVREEATVPPSSVLRLDLGPPPPAP